MDAFALFGLAKTYAIDLRALEQTYRALQKSLHPDQHVQSSAATRGESLKRAIEVNEAYRSLRSDIRRAELILGVDSESREEERVLDPEFLMQMLEDREALSDAKDSQDQEKVKALIHAAAEENKSIDQALRELLTGVDLNQKQIKTGRALLSKMRYYQRFLSEAALIDEALDELNRT